MADEVEEYTSEDVGFRLATGKDGIALFDQPVGFSSSPAALLQLLHTAKTSYVVSNTAYIGVGNLRDLDTDGAKEKLVTASLPNTTYVRLDASGQTVYAITDGVLHKASVEEVRAGTIGPAKLTLQTVGKVVAVEPSPTVPSSYFYIDSTGLLRIENGAPHTVRGVKGAAWCVGGKEIAVVYDNSFVILASDGSAESSYSLEEGTQLAAVATIDQNNWYAAARGDDGDEYNHYLIQRNQNHFSMLVLLFAPPFGDAERAPAFYAANIIDWFPAASYGFFTSALSTEISVVECGEHTRIVTQLNDSDRAELPMDEESGDDTLPVGFAIDLSGTDVVVKAPCAAADEATGVLPRLMCLNNMGRLMLWHVFNAAGLKNDSLSLQRAAKVQGTTSGSQAASVPTTAEPKKDEAKPAFGASTTSDKPAFGANPLASLLFGKAPSANAAGGAVFGSTSFGGSSFGLTGFGSSGFGQPKPAAAPQATSSFGAKYGSSGQGFGSLSSSTASPFGAISDKSKSVFGDKPSKTESPFGKLSLSDSPFGNTSHSKTDSPFSNLSGKTDSPFGSTKSTFGEPSLEKAASPFGQLSLGKAASLFGQPSLEKTASLFGQPSLEKTASPFGRLSLEKTPTPFGQPSLDKAPTPFGQSSLDKASTPFGQPSLTKGPSLFGQSSLAKSPSPFGQSAEAKAPSPFDVLKKDPATSNAKDSQSTESLAKTEKATSLDNFSQSMSGSLFGTQPSKKDSPFASLGLNKQSGNAADQPSRESTPFSGDHTMQLVGSDFTLSPLATTENAASKSVSFGQTSFFSSQSKNFSKISSEESAEASDGPSDEAASDEPPLLSAESESELEEDESPSNEEAFSELESFETDFEEEDSDIPDVPEITLGKFNGFSEAPKLPTGEVEREITSLVQSVYGQAKVLKQNAQQIDKLFDAQGQHRPLTQDDLYDSSLWRLSNIDDLKKAALVPRVEVAEVLHTLEDDTTSMKEVMDLVTESEQLKERIELMMGQAARFNNMLQSNNRPLDVRDEVARRNLRKKLAHVESLKDEVLKKLVPFGVRMDLSNGTLEKLEQVVYEVVFKSRFYADEVARITSEISELTKVRSIGFSAEADSSEPARTTNFKDGKWKLADRFATLAQSRPINARTV